MEEKNINSLIKNKDVFKTYVEKCYNRGTDFPNSSSYFHKRVIEMIRSSKNYKNLFLDKIFLEFVYATLSAWGLDRMDGSARLVEFDNFRKSVLDNISILVKLSNYKIGKINDIEKEAIKNKLSILFDSLEVMVRKAKLVGVSKALHHLLPDLIPPIDRKYTLGFFYGNTNYSEEDQKEKFLMIFDKFYLICKKLNLTEKDLLRRWDTSIPKLIDNAIIGFVFDSNN